MPETANSDLPTAPDAWQNREVLEELWFDRDWTKQQIADYFDELSDEPVTRYQIKKALHTKGLRKGSTQRPQRGLAAQLLDMPADAIGGSQ